MFVRQATTPKRPGMLSGLVRIRRRYSPLTGHSAPTECDSTIAVFTRPSRQRATFVFRERLQCANSADHFEDEWLGAVFQPTHPTVVAGLAYSLEPEGIELNFGFASAHWFHHRDA